MNEEIAEVKLVRLAPNQDVGVEATDLLAAQVAHILNTDEGLPEGMRRPSHLPPETSQGVLSFTMGWCRDHSAEFYAIVLPDGVVAGAITLSHIDLADRQARSGFFLATPYQERGYEARALSLLFDLCRSRGMLRVSSRVPEADTVIRRAWQDCGIPLEIDPNQITAVLI